MSEQTCLTCHWRFWLKDKKYACTLHNGLRRSGEEFIKTSDNRGGVFLVSDRFGCNQWEEKSEQSRGGS